MDRHSAEAKSIRKGKFGFVFIIAGLAIFLGVDLGVPAALSYVLAPIMIILGITALVSSKIE